MTPRDRKRIAFTSGKHYMKRDGRFPNTRDLGLALVDWRGLRLYPSIKPTPPVPPDQTSPGAFRSDAPVDVHLGLFRFGRRSGASAMPLPDDP